MHIKYSDPEREPVTEASNVIISFTRGLGCQCTHTSPGLGALWIRISDFDLELEESCFFFSSPTANRRQKNTIYLDLFRLFWMP